MPDVTARLLKFGNGIRLIKPIKHMKMWWHPEKEIILLLDTIDELTKKNKELTQENLQMHARSKDYLEIYKAQADELAHFRYHYPGEY